MVEQISTSSSQRNLTLEQEDGCDDVRSPCCSRFLAAPVDLRREDRSLHWGRFDSRTCDPLEGTYTEAVREDLQSVGRTCAGGVNELSPVEMRGVFPLRRKERHKQYVIN